MRVWVSFNNDENTLYFMLEALLVLEIFTSYFLKNGLIRKVWLISKLIFDVSQTRQQIITRNILPNISRSKCNQGMKFAQLIKYRVRNIFLQKSCRKWGRETSFRSHFVFFKALHKVVASGQHLNFNIFW